MNNFNNPSWLDSYLVLWVIPDHNSSQIVLKAISTKLAGKKYFLTLDVVLDNVKKKKGFLSKEFLMAHISLAKSDDLFFLNNRPDF